MKSFESILVVVPARLVPAERKQFIQNAMDFGHWLKCEVHFITDTGEAQAIENMITEFKRATPDGPSTLVIHPTGTDQTNRILETIEKYSCGLVVLEDGTVLYENEGAGTRGILELCPSPILLLPKDFNFRTSPPHSFLVPLSGEQRASQALSLSLKLARQTGSSVDFLHVTTPDKTCNCEQTLEIAGDQLHHEYREMTEKISAEASPYSTPEERKTIRHFHHCRGFTSDEILSVLHKTIGAILVLEWKGTLTKGHADTVKDILRTTHSATLFIRIKQERKSTLLIGKNLKLKEANFQSKNS